MEAKKKVKTAVYIPKQDSQLEQFARINNNKGKNKIFKLLKRLKRDKTDTVGKKFIRKLGKACINCI